MSKRIITMPIMGKDNTEIMKEFLESLDLNVVLPPSITDNTIKLGVKHSAEMICIPYKTTLGNYIEALDNGANTLLAYDTKGTCRFRQYNSLHETTLRGLGYEFEMHVVNPTNILSKLRELSGKSTWKILTELRTHYKRLKENEEQEWSDENPNIGIIGELYCCVDERVNHNLEEKILKFGGNPINTATTSNFIKNKLSLFKLINFFERDPLKEYKKQAEEFIGDWRSGHAYENLYNLLDLKDRGVDGIVHLAPLTCCPETTIEVYIDNICKDNKIPLLRLPIDENSAEKNLETRLETFCELLKMRGKK